MRRIALIVHDVRSAHNVGSVLRTADGLGIEKVYLSGYTPYPKAKNDSRLPHIADAVARRIRKTALGAEKFVPWQHVSDIVTLIQRLKRTGFTLIALEQTSKARDIAAFKSNKDIALIVGEETKGLPDKIIKLSDLQLQIPMLGQKESFNVSVAAAIALYHLRYHA